ncbi:hypothetical protein E3P81_02111 [Wallemia ichthyophaga]|nr:hypothetical protein E3P97_02110 [Wallemia ichthyophaga]TIB32743.1 hypothetical protein E3P85_01659 [Wallemia ichthyophaga]TIB46503.1 hypothetical protein E3P82_02108 [Wallemia ichthyophaga]TIB50494.1 hypothetical protein E3P81_02111 [Wallemia ichthyophaga]TIB53550.1 hypothetical protein E3P80_02109 [Wallemia ichthyophaga]
MPQGEVDEFDGILDEFEDKEGGSQGDFNKAIQDTLNNLNLNDSNDATDESDENLDEILESVMGELLSKDVLYEPLKELSSKYPEYLEQNKPPKLKHEDFENYSKQFGYVKDILKVFDNDGKDGKDSNDSKATDKSNVLDLMTKIQECGSPPKEIIGDFDSNNLFNEYSIQLEPTTSSSSAEMPLVNHPMPEAPDLSILIMIPIIFVSALIGLLIVIPVIGVLTRHRAHFNPKGVSLDPESNPTVGPNVDTYFKMAKRVKEVEGLAGFFKGFFPTLISEIFIGLLILIPLPLTLSAGFFGYFAAIVGLIFIGCVSLPFEIFIKRAIVTPYNLPVLTPRQNIRKLVTPNELSNPFKMINATLLQVLALRILISAVTIHILRPFLSVIPLFGMVSWQVLTVALILLINPLDVLQTRLMVQPLGQQDWDEETNHNKYEDAVVTIRQQPYHGVGDALRAIKEEEGTGALARGWWFTLVGQLAIAFSP